MKLSSAAAAAVALVAAAPAFAAPITIDFEDVNSFASIGGLYSAKGVTFGPDALGLKNDVLGPYFSNAPSPIGILAVVGPDATMNVAGGFTDFINFFYTSAADIVAGVQVFDGLDGTGNLLASFDLANNTQGCTDPVNCRFDPVHASFDGRAYSVTFGNAVGAGFDDITVPEPGTALLVPLAVAGLLAVRRRRG
jgi:hypothetical protein